MRWRDFSGGEMTNWGATASTRFNGPWAWTAPGRPKFARSPPAPTARSPCAIRTAWRSTSCSSRATARWAAPIFIGEKGKLEINRNKFASNPPEIAEELRKQLDVTEEERKWSDNLALWQARWHMQNWLDCIRSRNLPVADVEIGHRSISVCHLANIARAVGRPLRWDPTHEHFIDDEEANRYLTRPRRKGFELPTVPKSTNGWRWRLRGSLSTSGNRCELCR